MTDQPILEARNISKSFTRDGNTLAIIKPQSLQIHAGETVAIIGKSGAGKSTLLSLLAGLDQPDVGKILINNQSLTQLSEKQLAQLRSEQISFIFQSFHLLPELSALDNVCLPLDLKGLSDAQAQARHWLEVVGLTPRMHHFPTQLSGGEQQRVAIARAFAASPNILFADEPTGNLDEETGAAITEQLFRLNREAGTTLILITHDPELAQRCQRQLHLHNGLLTELNSTNAQESCA